MPENDPLPITCEECGAEDIEFLPHNAGCPVWGAHYGDDPELDAIQNATREYEDATRMYLGEVL